MSSRDFLLDASAFLYADLGTDLLRPALLVTYHCSVSRQSSIAKL